jgi:hypothetical protein
MDSQMSIDNQTPRAELWRPIPGASQYEISTLGRLRSLLNVDQETGQPYLMRLSLSDGYLCSRATFDDGQRRTIFAHQQVAAAFLGPRPPGQLVLHGNDIRTDNRLENLRYGTRADNAADAKRNGVRLPYDPETGRRGKLSAVTVRAIRNRVNDGESVMQIAKSLELDYDSVYSVATNQTYRHIKQTTAEQARARLDTWARREQARLERDGRRALANVEALERVEPPEGQRRRKAPHTPPTRAPRSRGSK